MWRLAIGYRSIGAKSSASAPPGPHRRKRRPTQRINVASRGTTSGTLSGMSDKCLAYERRGAVAIVTIDDAPHNRMTLAFMDALESLVATISSDAAIRAVVITAAGDRNFSVGMDL